MTTSLKVNEWTHLSKTERRDKLEELEQTCKKGIKSNDLVEAETPVRQFFSDGCYGREIFIPKGTCLVGDIHLTEWIIVVSRGKIRVASEDGIKVIDATEKPVTFISKAGAKRAGYAIEDTWWTGFRATDLTTEEEIRKEHLVNSYAELEELQHVGGNSSNIDNRLNNTSTETK